MAESIQALINRISSQIEASQRLIRASDKSQTSMAQVVSETRLAIARSRSLIRSIEERR